MAIDQRKKQKKLAKQRAKRKAKAASQKRAHLGRSSGHGAIAGLGFELAARAPIYKCYVADEVFDQGLGYVVVSRRSGEQVAAGIFLVDAYCLGVKNAFAMLKPREFLDDFIDSLPMRMREVEPAYAKKLVEDAVAYARDLGFEPHPDYKLPQKILNDIDASECATEFTFGKDGKPFFVSGPYDSAARSKHIIDTLQRRFGPDGYHYMMGLSPDEGIWIGDEPDDWEEDDEEYDEEEDEEEEDK
ncbi:MAG TPA: hypothetical protein VKE91_14745 [Blastocatellia bacterium]|nr:hypothetical protein [Blastocatellia bacterium]